MIWVVYDGFWNLYDVMQVFDRLFYLGSSKYGGLSLTKPEKVFPKRERETRNCLENET